MSRLIQIKDEHSKILGRRFLNSQLSLYIGIFQLIICVWALTQHIYSIIVFDEVLFCDFSENSTLPTVFTGTDAIIFDIGLFHSLWGISGCVAQHLDGGYGRFAWCVSHSLALIVCLPCAFMNRPKPFFMWPLLIQQSAYGIGLLILSLAALPRILPTFMGKLDNAPVGAILVYVLGTLMNFFLLFVYWHWYWHVESCWDSVRKVRTDRVLESHNRRSVSVRRPPIDLTPQKMLNIANGNVEIRTPLIITTNIKDVPIANGHSHNHHPPANNANSVPKQNGVMANGHARIVAGAQSLDTVAATKKFPTNQASPHAVTLLDNNDSQATMRRQSVLLDELSPIESSASSLGSSNSQQTHQHKRRLPTVSKNYAQRVSRAPFMQSQSSTLSLPISQPSNNFTRNHYSSNPMTNNFQYAQNLEQDSRHVVSARNEHYAKHRVGHRASLQQQQQIIEPHLRQMRRYQSHLTDMSPSSRVPQMPPPPAPSTPPIEPVIMRPMLRSLQSELPLRMAQYNCMQQQQYSGSEDLSEESSSTRHQRFYSAAI